MRRSAHQPRKEQTSKGFVTFCFEYKFQDRRAHRVMQEHLSLNQASQRVEQRTAGQRQHSNFGTL